MAVKKGSIYLKNETGLIKLDPEIEMDSVPTEGSSNPVSNAGICSAIESKAAKMFKTVSEEPADASDMDAQSVIVEMLPSIWSFTVDTRCLSASNKMSGIPVTLKGQPDISIEVDWGDGTSEVLTEETWQDSFKTECNVHEYAEPGKYVVRLKAADADWNAFYIDGNSLYGVGSGDSTYAIVTCTTDTSGAKYTKNLYYFKNTLVSLDSAIPPVAGMYEFHSSNASNGDKDKFKLTYYNATSGGLHYFFGSCIHLESISKHLFENLKSLISVSGCFYKCSSLKTVPEGLFDCLPNLKYVSEHLNRNQSGCFYGCSSLTSLPNNLFGNKSLLANVQGCFQACSSLKSIPEDLFSGLPDLTNVYDCFYGCTSLESIPSGLFSGNPNIITFNRCFMYCTSLKSIPDGLFAACSEAAIFSECFSNCTSLETVPDGLFSGCETGELFNKTFNGCTHLKSIPEDTFSGCVNARVLTACFSQCSSIESIPAGLFADSKKIINLDNCFASCSSLTEIPEGLFSGCSLVNTFAGCFYNCTDIQSVPIELFATNTAATNFSYAFVGISTTFSIRITSPSVVDIANFVTMTGSYTVYVPAGSTTYSTFVNADFGNLGLTVIEE